VPQIRLDMARVEVRPFCSGTAVNRFCCGKVPINRFIKNKAKKVERRCELRVFCAHVGDSIECIGYYALQIGTDSVADLPGAEQTYLRNYIAFPAVHLAYLGVAEPYQRQGLGQYLLMDVFTRVAEIARHAGFYALTVQSLDEESTKFYEVIAHAPPYWACGR
jgi:GNAT superfamily N-acetyltransferase